MHSEDAEPAQEKLRRELVRIKAEKNLSLDAFIHDTGYSRSSWNRVLKGQAHPPQDAVARLATRRKLDAAHLLALWEAADKARNAPAESPPPTAEAGAAETGNKNERRDKQSEGAGPTTDTAAPPAGPAPGPSVPESSGRPPAVSPSPAAPAAPTPSADRARPPGRLGPSRKWLVLPWLIVVLLIGRWYTISDGEDQARPSVGERPVDSQPPSAPSGPDGGEREPEDKKSEAVVPLPEHGEPSTTPDTESPQPTPSAPETEPPASSEKPGPSRTPPKTKTSAPPPPAASTADPGAAGRANCSHNSDRTQVMAKGMVGSKVRQIQCLLNNNYDYSLEVDGRFGTATDTAVRAVQSCSGIEVDGQVGPQTWKYLDRPLSGCGH
ncbi:peptidoglycan-binding protein [Streptomyces jumonjinensis]|uniref:peptidoglycan-binding protein n=1 Tax=Streptomyces jumonjinensis TaxID=1945 RepID=UPI0037AC3DB0